MPYHKNKQQAYQAAQQGVTQAKEIYSKIDKNSPEYGNYRKRLEKEIIEAEQQIQNALEVASETQRDQLYDMQEEMERLKEDLEY